MPWRGHNAHYCHTCGRHVSECGRLSARYSCAECGDAAMIENGRAMRARSGPRFHHWRRRMAASVGAVLADE